MIEERRCKKASNNHQEFSQNARFFAAKEYKDHRATEPQSQQVWEDNHGSHGLVSLRIEAFFVLARAKPLR